ncbi:MAG: beta-ketoacyl-[acyl-carrier-protein] synthase family protein [Actinobacteria bacterium]|nr:beta-ketoacyl-[acyl-carrier-protein] synthase family protein [Thermoleophilia bacterium]MCB9010321.1 beta-ketoacyl-[acyl-carrier-protein] synthase family protein [Actinomycetota bacterium]
MQRVVVTGLGVTCALGADVESFWAGLVSTASGAREIDVEGVGTIAAFPARDPDDAAKEHFGARESRRMDRVGRFAALAGAEALRSGGAPDVRPEQIGASLGCAHGGTETLMEAHRAFLERGADRVSPFSVALSLPNAPCAAMTRVLELRGPTMVTSAACAAGTDAIGFAYRAIRDGRAPLMLAGGAEAPITPVVAAGYLKAGALSPSTRPVDERSRPFDADRDGFVIGEGAGILLLESLDHALARGASVLAEVCGHGASCDAGHLTDPDPTGSGAARAMLAALEDAGLTPDAVEYVNAHATSTPVGDTAEARALQAAGVGHAAVSATKAGHGHTLGAAGGIEAVGTILALSRGVLPATRNLTTPDDGDTLDHVTEPRHVHVEVAVSTSFGFGGHNSCVVFRRPPGA